MASLPPCAVDRVVTAQAGDDVVARRCPRCCRCRPSRRSWPAGPRHVAVCACAAGPASTGQAVTAITRTSRVGTGPMLHPHARSFQVPTSGPSAASRVSQQNRTNLLQGPGKGPLSGPLSCAASSGTGIRTPNGRARTCCDADFTIPERAPSEDSAGRPRGLRLGDGEALLEPDEAPETDHPGHPDLGRLGDHVAELRQPL